MRKDERTIFPGEILRILGLMALIGPTTRGADEVHPSEMSGGPAYQWAAPRDRLTRLSGLECDGDLRDWQGHPFRVLGEGRMTEGVLSVVAREAWFDSGLAFGFQAMTEMAEGDRCTVDMFLDLRASAARMDRYETGVHHFVIDVSPSEKKPAVQEVGQAVKKAKGGREAPVAALVRTESGWTLEVALPWSAMGQPAPMEGSWIGLSTRFTLRRAGMPEAIEVGDVQKTAANTLETTPIAFRPVQVGGTADEAEPLSFSAAEKPIQGELYLEAECICPAATEDLAGTTFVVSSPELGTESTRFFKTISGRYWLARLRKKAPIGTDRLRLKLRVAGINDKTVWQRELLLNSPAAKKMGEISRAVPKRSASSEELEQVVRLMEECAEETALGYAGGAGCIETNENGSGVLSIRAFMMTQSSCLSMVRKKRRK